MMQRLRGLAWALMVAMPIAAVAAPQLSTSQRLELLERRAAKITELTLQLDEMRRENRELRGAVENLSYELEQLKRKQRDIYLDIDQRLSGMQGGGTVTPAAPVASGPTAAPVMPAKPAPANTADRTAIQADYKAAYALLSPQKKRYDEAAQAFAAFVKQYPNDELTPNAQYWLGEAYYVSQKNQPALQAFEVVINQYPTSSKAPGALFKIGRLKEATGRVGEARAAYQRVLNDYPNAPAAGLSRQRLKQLGG